MEYVSTRGGAPPVTFSDVLIGNLAGGRGLWMPACWPAPALPHLALSPDGSYAETARLVLAEFVGAGTGGEALRADVEAAYACFDDPEIAPLVQLEENLFLLELFHGPTLAFKDIAMQLLARLVVRELARRKARASILVATSGDTGSAAIAAFGGLPQIEVFVLHPKDRVSEVQRRQMTTAPHANIHNIALEGTFDDAQALVKTIFQDRAYATAMSLIAVNSINLVRILAQSVYYFRVTAKLGQARFVVPTGNFGDIFAGEAAARMGAPIAGLVAATNANDILARALGSGIYAPLEARATLSPSMDIQVASNFERALFEASDRDGRWVADAMGDFARSRSLAIPASVLARLAARYSAEAVSDAETLEAIGDAFRRWGRLLDPHTAVGLVAARRARPSGGVPTVVLATAHPAKFPETVARATGTVPPLPARLRHSYVGPERMAVLPTSAQDLRRFIETRNPTS